MPEKSRRQHLIDIALEMFAEHGFHATGIDMVMERAKMSKKTLYSYFRSKEELILACLRHHDGIFRNHFMMQVEKNGGTVEERLLGVFDVAAAWFCQNNFFGCIFINAVGEYSDQNSPIRQVSKDFKKLMRTYILSLTRQLPVQNCESLANQLALLLEGAIVTAQVSQKPEAADEAKQAASTILSAALNAPQKAAA